MVDNIDDDCTQLDAQIHVPDPEPMLTELPDYTCNSITVDTSSSRKRSFFPERDRDSQRAKKAKATISKSDTSSSTSRSRSCTSSPTLSPKTPVVTITKPVPPTVTNVVVEMEATYTSAYDELFHVMENTLGELADRDMKKLKIAFVDYHRSVFVQRASCLPIDVKGAKSKLSESINDIVTKL